MSRVRFNETVDATTAAGEPLPAEGITQRPTAASRTDKHTILVVDDTLDIVELTTWVLEGAGYTVRQARNGAEALTVIDELAERPCLVLLDLMMPVMDGRMFLEKLQAHHRVAALPVVVVSAAMTGGVLGAERVVRKPVAPDVLLSLVAEFCGPP